MITRDPPFFFDVACDRCAHGERRVEAEDFREAVDAIKTEGWQVTRVSGEWEHICPDCQMTSDFE